MDFCCSHSGDSPVEFEPDCYSWCHIAVHKHGGNDFHDALQEATDKFAYCLAHGINATSPTGMACNAGTNFTQPDASATITSTSQRGMDATEAATALAGESSGTSGNGAVPAVQTGNAKAAGFVGVLLAAGAFGAGL